MTTCLNRHWMHSPRRVLCSQQESQAKAHDSSVQPEWTPCQMTRDVPAQYFCSHRFLNRIIIEVFPLLLAKATTLTAQRREREKNFVESYCVKITDIPIHLINQIKDQMKRRRERTKKEWNRSYLLLIRMDYTPTKLQSKLMRILTQMYRLTKEWKTRLFKSLRRRLSMRESSKEREAKQTRPG